MNYITQQNIGGGGRLGNSLFGISCLYATAKRLNLAPVLPPWEYSKYFANHLPTSTTEITHFYKEPYFHYTEIDLGEAIERVSAENKVYNLEGYFQSAKYWKGYEDDIRKMFEPNWNTLDNAVYASIYLASNRKSTCSIHIRRGDYIGNNFYSQLDMNYYERAMLYVKEQTRVNKFVIFSDDIEWCKEHFVGDEFEFSEGMSDIEDLIIMSKMDNNIIANSSYSWWGAYLNPNPDKIIVAPTKDKWFGSAANLNVDDLYCDNWVCL